MNLSIDPGFARSVLSRFHGKRILVVGDVMLDEFLWGECERISPEAPVPVVHISNETFKLGGASNVAHNISTLGGKISVVGVIGDDRFGDLIVEEMRQYGIHTESIIRDRSRPTTVKTRIIAHSQQVVRADRESSAPVSDEIESSIVGLVESLAPGQDAVIISDYGKGMITDGSIGALLQSAQRAQVPVFVDPSVKYFNAYQHVTLIAPNALKAKLLTHIEPKDERSRIKAGMRLAETCKSSVLLTLGEFGMMLFHDGQVTSIPAVAREVYDVTGASDTVVSTFALSHAAGASMKEAALLANFAAGIVVRKVGTATATTQEILREIRINQETVPSNNSS